MYGRVAAGRPDGDARKAGRREAAVPQCNTSDAGAGSAKLWASAVRVAAGCASSACMARAGAGRLGRRRTRLGTSARHDRGWAPTIVTAGAAAEPGRRMVDAVADVATNAAPLELDGCAATGGSGGGPNALACGALPGHRDDAVSSGRLAGIVGCRASSDGRPVTRIRCGVRRSAARPRRSSSGWPARRRRSTTTSGDRHGRVDRRTGSSRCWTASSEALVVSGHTHVQFDRTVAHRRLVNAGSVGMPYQGESGWAYCPCSGQPWSIAAAPLTRTRWRRLARERVSESRVVRTGKPRGRGGRIRADGPGKRAS